MGFSVSNWTDSDKLMVLTDLVIEGRPDLELANGWTESRNLEGTTSVKMLTLGHPGAGCTSFGGLLFESRVLTLYYILSGSR